MKLSEIKTILAENGIRLTKSLGQNFLFDANQLRKIIDLAGLKKSDRVLEIGPGLGSLTELLLVSAGEVLAIEKDARLFQVLQQRLESERGHSGPQQPPMGDAIAQQIGAYRSSRPAADRNVRAPILRLLHDDALDFLRREERDWSEWKLVSNLPYSIASPMLVELAQASRGPECLVATLQSEVANRLMAGAGTADYGLLSLLIQLNYRPQSVFKIPASCFFPEPEVDSACIALRRRASPLLAPELAQTFRRVVKRSFSQRRKMMWKLLKTDWPERALEKAFERERLSPQIRAEKVTLEQFVGLTNSLTQA